ncbi:kinase-like domain-containing protein [Tricladium varicosporioides]|nr:kinase-like domain-containing protein [Hymenoscyphus varicosporioides]
MRDVVQTNSHWYLLSELIDGGQMLDYVISHGRLSEKKARKFSRQISSALDYAHHNNISHRDLRLENVLVTRSDDIKIIDFGDCNFFEADNSLKTFCGWKYSVAPEVLAGVGYQGPSVDIWQFGIILYTMVCGKVPFDDPSTPKLYEKIKYGNPDFPNWLTVDCISLIKRMLVTQPSQRAILQEIMNHPWMIQGFGSQPANHLPRRESITLPIDQEVVAAMTGFTFGSPEVIEAKLIKIIKSSAYKIAVLKAATQEEIRAQSYNTTTGYGKPFLGINLRLTRDTIANSSDPALETLRVGEDPFNAFHPLISIYYLVREKQDRERIARSENLIRKPIETALQPAGIFSDLATDGPEIGTLVVIIDRAKNLPDRKKIGKQDPFCVVKFGKEAKKTTTDRRGGQTPKWDHELRFVVHDSPDYYQLKVTIFNDDKNKKMGLIGEKWVDLRDVIVRGGGQKDFWQSLSCGGKYAGEVRAELTFYDSRPRQ